VQRCGENLAPERQGSFEFHIKIPIECYQLVSSSINVLIAKLSTLTSESSVKYAFEMQGGS
jgi:hypothetical protein